MDRTTLAEFLRTRRDGLRPEDVGLSTGPRRRTAGLRRDEVALLAGMSTDYYVRLEQARSRQPSEQMLASLARALRLDNDERDYLYRLAGQSAPDRSPLDTHVAPGLLRVMDRLDNTPALILSSLSETLVQNHLSLALHGDQSKHTGLARSGIYRWFTDPAEREVYEPGDHDHQARALVSGLRASYGLGGEHSRAGALVRALHKVSSEFTELWQRHEVARRFADHKVLLHPEVGRIELDCQALFTEDQGQTLLVLTAAPRTEASEKLALLAVLGQQPVRPPSPLTSSRVELLASWAPVRSLRNGSPVAVYTLPDLPYDYAALEPHISGKIMQLHHDKHHAAYVSGANAALEKLAEARDTGNFGAITMLEKDLAFHLGGHVNHTIFWQNLSPEGGGEPEGELAEAIKDQFGSVEAFRKHFAAVATSIQGSGWSVLAWDSLGQKLLVFQLHDQQANVPVGIVPLFMLDMWEHAFYLDYLNVKADYVKAVWNLVNWADVQQRLTRARASVI